MGWHVANETKSDVEQAKHAVRQEKISFTVSHLELAKTRLTEWLAFETEPGLKDRIYLALRGVDDALDWVKP